MWGTQGSQDQRETSEDKPPRKEPADTRAAQEPSRPRLWGPGWHAGTRALSPQTSSQELPGRESNFAP